MVDDGKERRTLEVSRREATRLPSQFEVTQGPMGLEQFVSPSGWLRLAASVGGEIKEEVDRVYLTTPSGARLTFSSPGGTLIAAETSTKSGITLGKFEYDDWTTLQSDATLRHPTTVRFTRTDANGQRSYSRRYKVRDIALLEPTYRPQLLVFPRNAIIHDYIQNKLVMGDGQVLNPNGPDPVRTSSPSGVSAQTWILGGVGAAFFSGTLFVYWRGRQR